ncbi:MAG: anti-sigma factor domain-containing protein [Chloroflexia bacterium]
MTQYTDNTSDPFQEQVVAYALDVLDPQDIPAVEAHLATCANCRADLAALRAAATALAWDLEPAAEPPGHHDRFVQKLDAISPIPEPTGHRERFRDKLTATSVAAAPARAWWMSLNPFVGLGLAGAFAVLLLVVGLWGLGEQRSADDAHSRLAAVQQRASDAEARLAAAQQQANAAETATHNLQAERSTLLAVINSPAVKSASLTSTGPFQGAHAQVWLDPNTQKVVVAAAALPSPPPGKVYELWLMRGKTPVAVDVFQPKAGDQALLIFDAPPSTDGYTVAAITVESGKVEAPTSPIILAGNFQSSSDSGRLVPEIVV